MSPAQNCIRYICTQRSESPLSGPPVRRIPIPAFHSKVQLRSNLYAQRRRCSRDELTQHCYFHHMEYSAPLKWWRSAAALSHFSACVVCSLCILRTWYLHDPHWFWHWGFHVLPQSARENPTNAHGSIQSSSPYSPLVSGATGLQMTVSPSWVQRFSKGLRLRLLVRKKMEK